MTPQFYSEGNTIYMYSPIGGEGMTATDFTKMLNELKPNNNALTLRINSGGGSVFDGYTIFNSLKSSGLKIKYMGDKIHDFSFDIWNGFFFPNR